MTINMAHSHKKLLLAGLLLWVSILCVTPKLYAQDDARIYHVTGGDFALTLLGIRSFPSAESARSGGIKLERGGIVHTGPKTLVEIQLLSSGTVIKMAENSSLIYNGLDETGRFEDIGLLYGRIRVVTGAESRSARADSVVIRGGGVSVKVKEGDFAADYLLETVDRETVPQPLFNISAIRGSAEVFPYGMGGSSSYFGGVNVLNVNRGECLSLDISSFHTFAEKKPLERETLVFWRFHNFLGSPPRTMPNTWIAVDEAPLVDPSPRPSRIVRLYSSREKNLLLTLGLSLTTFSVAVQAITHPQFDLFSNKDLGRSLHNIAYVPLGMGLVTTLVGILYNPPSRQ